MTWTPHRVDTLKAGWADGCSASQIAKDLGGVTRSAVLGKVSRLGLAGRHTVSYVRRGNGVIVPSSTPKKQNNPSHFVRTETPRTRLPTGDLPPAEPLAPIIPTTEHLCSIMNLTNTTCRYPCWDDGTPFEKQFYCGNPSANLDEGRPYCAGHALLTFTKPLPVKPRPYFRERGERVA